ncbi:hypothetical protein ACFT7S_02815 [Streptomyces sp. NPDC057136]|uniref:hypothetical protein n=1 Tax=Streptomyces sp. NPDC057136 TaxID=3346029 RepID=UPI003635C919
MAPGLLPSRRSRSSRCVLCLAVSAAAVLGPASWTYAAERVPGAPGAPGGVAHRSAGSPSADAGARGPLTLAPRSAEPPGTATGGPSTAPTTGTPAAPSSRPTTPPPPVPASRPSVSSSAATSASPSVVPSGTPSTLPSGAAGSAGPPSGSAAPPAGSSASPSASADRSPLAGRPAGEGRARPGRSLSPLELARADALLEEEESEQDTGEVPPAEVTPSASPSSGRSAPQAMDAPAVRQVQEVSLGAGIALVGLGLGFLAFRMRRVR